MNATPPPLPLWYSIHGYLSSVYVDTPSREKRTQGTWELSFFDVAIAQKIVEKISDPTDSRRSLALVSILLTAGEEHTAKIDTRIHAHQYPLDCGGGLVEMGRK